MSFKKQQKSTFLLVIIVLIIWGGLTLRVFNSISSQLLSPELTKKEEKEFFVISKRNKYRVSSYPSDPFLGKLTTTKKPQSIKPKSIKVKGSEIRYLGCLSTKKREKYLFNVNNQTILWQLGEKKFGLILNRKQKTLILSNTQTRKKFPILPPTS